MISRRVNPLRKRGDRGLWASGPLFSSSPAAGISVAGPQKRALLARLDALIPAVPRAFAETAE